MADAPDKGHAPAGGDAAPKEAAAGGKAAMMIPLAVAAVISVAGSFGVGFFLNKQLLTGINKELEKALAEVHSEGGDSHGDAGHDAHGNASTAKAPKKETAAAAGAHGETAKKADDAHGGGAHGEPAKKADDGHGGGGGHGEPAKPKESPEAAAKAAQAKAGLFPLGSDPIVANPSGDSRFVVVKVTIVSVGQADISAEVDTHIDRLRDAVTGFLADQSIEAIQQRGFRSQMGAQLALAFNRILGPGTVREVIFPQFVIQ